MFLSLTSPHFGNSSRKSLNARFGERSPGRFIVPKADPGSLIGTMPISPNIHVVALEGSQDLVPTLDGAVNPKTWTTVHQTGYPLVGESNPTMNPPTSTIRIVTR